jgi:hypothetical protein
VRLGFDPPVYVCTRDRVCDLRKLVTWLEWAGHQRIVIVDNASTFDPLVDYLSKSPHDVVRLHENLGSRALWAAGLVPDEWFVWTDPDLVPIEECPRDLVGALRMVLGVDQHATKAGAGLHLDDTPVNMKSGPWERSRLAPTLLRQTLRTSKAHTGAYWDACMVDTTFALYRPGATFTHAAYRLGWPYQMRHMPWYPAATEEERVERDYYLKHAKGGPIGSSWKDGLQ